MTPARPPAPDARIESLLPRLAALAAQGRRLVAIAGAPGSGKSTLAEALAQTLNDRSPGRCAVLPMDGFHFDDAVLQDMGTLARKGAPFTFDVDGLDALLARLRANDADQVAVPVFDRHLEIARAGARLIFRETPLLLVEGNYLLLDQPPWAALARHFDLTIRLDVPMPELRRRLVARWLHMGFSHADAEARALTNDLPNAETALSHSRASDIILDWRDG